MGENTQKIADFVAEVGFDDLPADIVHETKRVLLDSIGCAVAGLAMRGSAIAVELATRLGGPKEASIIGTGKKVACPNAALANGQLVNAKDFDAGAAGHDTPAVIGGVLSMAEAAQASGMDLLLAVAVTHELATKFSVATGRTGAPEGVAFATPAVAAGCGKLLNLTPEEICRAIGISSFIHPPNTIRSYINISPVWMTKYTVFGQIAQAGVNAALLAQMGFTGDVDALDGDECFWKTNDRAEWAPERLTEGLGETWSHRISYKRYPSNFSTAAAKDCLIEIIEENNVQPEEIEKITARIWAIWLTRTMQENRLRTEEEYCYNVPYQLTCAAHRLKPTRWLDREVREDPKLKAFMQRVEFDIGCSDQQIQPEDPEGRNMNLSGAKVVARGQTFQKQTLYYQGQHSPPEYRMKDEEIIDKFRENVSRVVSPDAANRVVEAVFELEKQAKVTDIMDMLAPE